MRCAQPVFTLAELLLEAWRAIPGWEDLYAVSSLGRVKSFHTYNQLAPGRILRVKLMKGYEYVTLARKGEKHCVPVHHLVALAFIGLRPPGHEINHIAVTEDPMVMRRNNRAENLEYVTKLEHAAHTKASGLLSTGERHYKWRLSKEQDAAILLEYSTSRTSQAALGKKYGVAQSCIGRSLKRARARV
jgi:hypothetical protein